MQTAIVTVQTADGRFRRDMELPTNLSVGDLKQKILALIGAVDPKCLQALRDTSVYAGQQLLDEEHTLDEQGVFDGAYITMGEIR